MLHVKAYTLAYIMALISSSMFSYTTKLLTSTSYSLSLRTYLTSLHYYLRVYQSSPTSTLISLSFLFPFVFVESGEEFLCSQTLVYLHKCRLHGKQTYREYSEPEAIYLIEKANVNCQSYHTRMWSMWSHKPSQFSIIKNLFQKYQKDSRI